MTENTLYRTALSKAMSQCSRRELCCSEVESKLETWGLQKSDCQKIIDILINENFINEERYAHAFVKDKFNHNRWGRIKIAAQLRAKNISDSFVTGTDISHEALIVARGNAGLNNVKVEFIEEDIFNPLRLLTGRQGIIVSNPPYVLLSEKALMNRNVLEYEPPEALFVNDSEPLLYYNSILLIAEKILQPGGKVYFEINEAMGRNIIVLFETFRYSDIKLFKDINGKDRIIRGIFND